MNLKLHILVCFTSMCPILAKQYSHVCDYIYIKIIYFVKIFRNFYISFQIFFFWTMWINLVKHISSLFSSCAACRPDHTTTQHHAIHPISVTLILVLPKDLTSIRLMQHNLLCLPCQACVSHLPLRMWILCLTAF